MEQKEASSASKRQRSGEEDEEALALASTVRLNSGHRMPRLGLGLSHNGCLT
jgi:hypothetical protein